MREISEDGLALVKAFEGLQLKAYRDEKGIWTIGWGHTGLTHNDGTVHAGRVITEAEAAALLRHDMGAFAARVTRFITEQDGITLNDDEFAALVAFDFNTGGLEHSTLRALLARGLRHLAAEQFPRWDKCDGARLRGLTRRRLSEQRLFLSRRPFIVTMEELAAYEKEHELTS